MLLLHDSDSYGSPGFWRATAAALPIILRTCHTLGMPVGSLQTLSDAAPTAADATAAALPLDNKDGTHGCVD